jgi:hypothetical protein
MLMQRFEIHFTRTMNIGRRERRSLGQVLMVLGKGKHDPTAR